MSAEEIDFPKISHRDTFADMMSRRILNDFAEQPVDFYTEGLKKAQTYTSLCETDVLLDIGCSNGQFILDAVKATQIKSHIIGIDPEVESFIVNRPKGVNLSQFNFIKGVGEYIPLLDNAIKVTKAHNVLFRAKNLFEIISEIKRVTVPDGLIIISTNAKDHAVRRHEFEKMIAVDVSNKTGIKLPPFQPPAKSCYLEDLPTIIDEAKGLEIIDDSVVQKCETIITKDRVDDYENSIRYSVSGIELPPVLWSIWRRTVDEVVTPIIRRLISERESIRVVRNADGTEESEAYFADKAHRGMVILRNKK